jgi:hypothetical protein
VDLLGECGVKTTFNISHLFLFYVGDDLKLNSFKKRWDNTIQITPNNPLEVLVRPITRSMAKKLKYVFNKVI